MAKFRQIRSHCYLPSVIKITLFFTVTIDASVSGLKNKQYFAFSQQEEITKTIKIMVHGTNICISKITIHGEGAKEKKAEL